MVKWRDWTAWPLVNQPAVSKSESIPKDEKADSSGFTAAERLFFNKYPE
jgi:hypothetical protein